MNPAAILVAAFGPLLESATIRYVLRGHWNFYTGWAGGGIGGAIGSWQAHALLPVALNLANVVLALVCWWLSRRRRRRSPKLAGAKSKALLAAVVRVMRERARPRPVFRPQQQGV